MNKKILFVGDGNSIHIHKWLKYFTQDNYFDIYLFSDTKINNTNKLFYDKNNIKIIDINFTNNYIINNIFLFLYKFILYFYYIFIKIKPNIIHIHFVSINSLQIFPIIFSKKIKKIATFWGSDYNIKNIIRHFIRLLITRYYDIITSDTKEILIGLNNEYKVQKEKLFYINHGVKTELLINREKNNTYKDKYVIFSPRGLQKLYNHHILFENIEKIIKKIGKNILLIFIDFNSNIEYKKRLLNIIKKYPNNIELLPSMNQKELYNMYNNSNIIISIPQIDGFPITIIEAILSKKPIIGLKHPDYIKNLPNKFLINEKELNIKNIINKINELKGYKINNDLITKYVEKFDHNKNMKKMLNLYLN